MKLNKTELKKHFANRRIIEDSDGGYQVSGHRVVLSQFDDGRWDMQVTGKRVAIVETGLKAKIPGLVFHRTNIECWCTLTLNQILDNFELLGLLAPRVFSDTEKEALRMKMAKMRSLKAKS
jgi:hypothetical protein